MKVATKQIIKKSVRSAGNPLRAAASSVLELLENRMMLSTTPITDWSFDNLTVQTTPATLSPAPLPVRPSA